MLFFGKKGRHAKKKKEKAEELPKFDINEEIAAVKKKFESSGMSCQGDFFKLFKHFFKHYFRIKYSFTYEEFNNEVKNNKILDKQLKNDIIMLSSKLSNIEYGTKKLSNNELKFLITDFEAIVPRILELKKEKKPKFIPSRIFVPFIKIKEKLVNAYNTNKSKFMKVMTQTKEELRKRHLEHLDELIAKTQEHVRNKNAKNARESYSELKEIFQKLPVEDKRANYRKIMDLYDAIVKL